MDPAPPRPAGTGSGPLRAGAPLLLVVGAARALVGVGVGRRGRPGWALGLAVGPLFCLDGLLHGSPRLGSPPGPGGAGRIAPDCVR